MKYTYKYYSDIVSQVIRIVVEQIAMQKKSRLHSSLFLGWVHVHLRLLWTNTQLLFLFIELTSLQMCSFLRTFNFERKSMELYSVFTIK